MGNVIPMASQYGISLEDLSTAYVILTRQGINTARTTTYLRSAFTELEKEGSDASDALKAKTGKTFMQLLADGKNLGDIFQILRDSVNGDQEAFIHLFGSIRSGAGALALANTSSKEYNDILNEVSYSAGQTARNVQKLETPSLKWKRMLEQIKNTAMDLGQTILDILYPHLVKLAESVKNVTDWFKKLSPETKKSIVNMGAVAAAIPPLLTGFGKMTAGIAGAGVSIIRFLRETENATSGIGLLARKLVLAMPYIAGLVVVIGAASAAMTIFGGKINEAKQQEILAIREQYKYSDAIQDTMSKVDELKNSYDEYKQSAAEKIRSDSVGREIVSNLRDKYNELLDANGNVKKGNEELAAFYKEGLAEAMGTTVEGLDEMIQKYGDLDTAVDTSIENMKKEAQMAVYKEWLKEATRANLEAQKEYNNILQESGTAYKDYQEAAAKASEAQALYQEAQLNHADNTEVLRQEFERLNEEAGIAEQKWRGLEESAGTARETLNKTQIDLNDINDVIAGKLNPSENDLIKTTEEAEKTIGEAGETTKQTVATTSEEANQTLDEGLDTAKRELDHRIPEIAKQFDIDLTDTGKNTIDGWINGWISKEDVALMHVRGFAHNVKTVLEQEGKIASPSKVMAEIGGYYGQGFIEGLDKYVAPARGIASALANAAIPDTSWTSNYSRLPDYAYGTTNNTRNISAPIAVNVNVNGNVDDPNGLADIIEQRLVEKIINNERAFA